MNTTNVISELPHRPLAPHAPIKPSVSKSPSRSRYPRRRLLDREPWPPDNPSLGSSTLSCAKRKSAPSDEDWGDETRRGRSRTRSLSPEYICKEGVDNKTYVRKRRRKRRRSLSPSRGGQASRQDDRKDRDVTSRLRVKRRWTKDVEKHNPGNVPGSLEHLEKGEDTSGESERSRSRLRTQYRRLSERANMEYREGIFSGSVEAEDSGEAASEDAIDMHTIGNRNANIDVSMVSPARKENAGHQEVIQGWGYTEREEWGIGMRNREEVAGRKAEGKGWLREGSQEA